jgi:hypothetical protein
VLRQVSERPDSGTSGKRENGRWKRGSVVVHEFVNSRAWNNLIAQAGAILDHAADLAAQGMSTRAIAPIVGVSVGTIHADRQVFNSEHLPPAPVDVTPTLPPRADDWTPRKDFYLLCRWFLCKNRR